VSSSRGSVTLPLVLADLPDRVVWVPMRTPEAAVRRDLAVHPGEVVRLSTGAASAGHETAGHQTAAPANAASEGDA
jgi:NADH-quinone oxidoreductase subunit G